MTETTKPGDYAHRRDPVGSPMDEGFVIFYTVSGDTWIDFLVVECGSESMDETTPLYGQNGSEDPDQAERLLRGHIKWDGCVDVEMGDPACMTHFCGLRDALVLERAVRAIYALAEQHMPKFDASLAGTQPKEPQ